MEGDRPASCARTAACGAHRVGAWGQLGNGQRRTGLSVPAETPLGIGLRQFDARMTPPLTTFELQSVARTIARNSGSVNCS